MGIQGLLPTLKTITSTIHVSKYSGQRIAIDAYSWLHKGAYSCSRELCEGTFTDKYVTYCMDRVRLLRGCGVVPVLVFDGGRLPMKALEEASRAKARKEHLQRAAAHLHAGNACAANECFQKAVDISPAVAKRLIDALKGDGVEFIVAPYEADAQMAYMALSGDVDAVITEDSDLLAYGCPKVLFKMDRSGECQEIALEDLNINRELNFVGFTPQMFLEMCIMAGCDFVKALPSIGIKKAHQHIRRLRSFVRVSKSLRFSCSVPRTYEEDVQRAVWTFRHQRVFCPRQRRLVHLRPLPEGGLAATAAVPGAVSLNDEALEFLGPPLPDDVACQVAAGELNPITLQPYPAEQAACIRHSGSAAATEPAQNGILDYFRPHARISEQAARDFRPPGRAAPGSGGLLRDVLGSSQRPAAVASMHSEGCQSQPESLAAEASSSEPSPGDGAPRGLHRLAPSDARSERQQPTRLGGGQQRLDLMLQGGRLGRPRDGHDEVAGEDQEEVSPVRAHPLAAGMRRPSLRLPGRTAHAAAGATVQAQQPAKRPRLQLAQQAAGAADGDSRVLQELPLPARNSGSSSSPAPQRPAKRTERTGAAAQGGAAAAAEPDAAAGVELARGFGDLSHMRRFAVEASKALDGLRRQQRRTPAKGPRPAAVAGAGGGGGSPGGAVAARGRDGKQAATAAAARATIEKFKRQLARPPGRTPPKAGREGAGEAAAAEPADAAAAGDAAELQRVPAATPVRLPHSRGSPGMRRSSFYDDGSDDIFSQLSNPGLLPCRRADGRYAMLDSLVPESPNVSLRQLSGSQPLSQADQQQWRLLSGGSPARPAVSDPSPGLLRRQPQRDLSPSPSQRRQRRLSVGALSDGWLSDPSDDEADLLAADGFLAQSPLQSPCQSPPPSPGLADAGAVEQELVEDRLFALARGSGRLRRCSSGAVGLAGVEDFDSFAGIDGSDPVEAFSPAPSAAVQLAGRFLPPAAVPLEDEELLDADDDAAPGQLFPTASPLLASTMRQWLSVDAGDGGGDDANGGGGGSHVGSRWHSAAELQGPEADGGMDMQQPLSEYFAAIPETEPQDMGALGLSPEQPRQLRSRTPCRAVFSPQQPRRQPWQDSPSAGRPLSDLLPDGIELAAGQHRSYPVSPVQHGACHGSGSMDGSSGGGGSSTAALIAELQHREDVAEGRTPRQCSSIDDGAAAFAGQSDSIVPESPLGLAEPDERAELNAVLGGRSPHPGAGGRCGGGDGNYFGRYAFKAGQSAV